MTATTADRRRRRSPTLPTGPVWLLRDSWTEATRHLRAVPRNPELLVFATIQPIMFVVLFVYVFGGVDRGAGLRELQAVPDARHLRPDRAVRLGLHRASASPRTCSKGFIDRLRSLPMYPSAVLIGRTMCDLVRNIVHRSS